MPLLPDRRPRYISRLFMLALLCTCTIGVAMADTGRVLRVLAWPGYADPDVVQAFERRTRARVELTIVNSDDVMWEKISANGGAGFDVFAVNTAELQRYIDGALAKPINLKALPNTRQQAASFRDLSTLRGLMRNGDVYGIPYTYAEMGLIYDRRQFATPPDSISALWDPGLAGKVLAYDGSAHNFSLAQIKRHAPPFHITATEWPSLVDDLIALRRNVLAFYAGPEESVELFLRHDAALLFANYGAQQMQLLQQAGADVGYVVPKEGALAWLDCWALSAGVRDQALAAAWINYTLEEPVSALLVTRHGLSSTRASSPPHQSTHKLFWLEPVENASRRTQLWTRIRSGDNRARVLQP